MSDLHKKRDLNDKKDLRDKSKQSFMSFLSFRSFGFSFHHAKIVFLALFLLSGSLYANEMQQVRNEFEAGNYAEAKELLQEMQKGDLLPWQREALAYNIGTVDLAMGNVVEALNLFRAIAPDANPYLKEKVMMNASIALWQEVKMLLPITSFSAMREAINKLRSSLDAIHSIDAENFPEGEKLRQVMKPVLANLLEERLVVWEKHGTLRDGILGLLIGLHRTLEQVDFLENITMSDSQKMDYQRLYLSQQKSWLPLWDFLVDKDRRVKEAKNEFLQGVRDFSHESFKVSYEAFSQAIDQLKKLLHEIWGDDMISDLLAPIYGKYERALEHETLSALPFQNILEEQQLLLGVIPDLQKSNLLLNAGISALNNGKQIAAKINLSSARQVINRLLRDKNEGEPEVILEAAIEDQHHALNIGNMVWLSKQQALMDIPIEAQKETVETASPFLGKVFAWQNTHYPEECQCHPWDKALPLFEKGRQAAVRAERLYQEGADKAPIALALEKQALEFWEKALQALREVEEEKEEQTEEQPDEGESAEEEKSAVNVEEVLRLLQQMEQDDRQPRQQIQPMKGIKPW